MCTSIAKCIFGVISVIVLIIGAAFTAVGALVVFFLDSEFVHSFFKAAEVAAELAGVKITITADVLKEFPLLFELGIGLFALGGILLILGVLGFCGACCSCCGLMLKLFVVVMVILMIGEIVIGTMFLVPDSPLHENVRKNLKERLAHFDYRNPAQDPFSQSINIINYLFKCCGIDGKYDFKKDLHHKPPFSCISSYTPKVSVTYHSSGCYTELTDLIQQYILYLGLGFAAVLTFQLIQVVLAIIIFKKANKVSPFK